MKTAIFDMDGTLLDSMGMWRNVLPNYLKTLNIENGIDINTIVENMSFREAATYVSKALDLGKTADDIYGEIEADIVYQYEHIIELKPYVKEYLAQLKTENIFCAVATLTDKYMAELVLKRLGIFEYFDYILTVAEAGKSKEFPDIYLQCAKHFGVAKEECAVFEDAPYAIKTAKNAGFLVYGVYDPWQKYPEGFSDKYCDAFVLAYDALLKK